MNALDRATIAAKARKGRATSAGLYGWSDAAYRDALHAAAVDGCVTANAYGTYRAKQTHPMPTQVAFEMRYGSWTRAVEANGRAVRRAGLEYKRTSKATLARNIAVVVDAAGGHLPSVAEYDEYRRAHPDAGLLSSALIRRRFPSWPAALSAGVRARDREAARAA